MALLANLSIFVYSKFGRFEQAIEFLLVVSSDLGIGDDEQRFVIGVIGGVRPVVGTEDDGSPIEDGKFVVQQVARWKLRDADGLSGRIPRIAVFALTRNAETQHIEAFAVGARHEAWIEESPNGDRFLGQRCELGREFDV